MKGWEVSQLFHLENSNHYLYFKELIMGKIIIVAGLIIALFGVILQFSPQVLSWFGKLPGDLKYEKGNFKFFFPLTTMIIVSVVLTLLLKIFGK